MTPAQAATLLDAYRLAVLRTQRAVRVSRVRLEDHVERVEAMEAEAAARKVLEAALVPPPPKLEEPCSCGSRAVIPGWCADCLRAGCP